MSSLLSAEEKAEYESVIDSVHETFARDILVYGDPIVSVVSNEGGNPLYPYPKSSDVVSYSDNVVTISARVLYGKQTKSTLTGGLNGQDAALEIPDGWVRIKVDISHKEVMELSKRVQIDGEFYTMNSFKTPHGLFSPKYLTFLLKPIDG